MIFCKGLYSPSLLFRIISRVSSFWCSHFGLDALQFCLNYKITYPVDGTSFIIIMGCSASTERVILPFFTCSSFFSMLICLSLLYSLFICIFSVSCLLCFFFYEKTVFSGSLAFRDMILISNVIYMQFFFCLDHWFKYY